MRAASEPLPFPTSQCHQCGARRYVRSTTSVFLMCTTLTDKYPRQPVVRCPDFRPRPTEADEAEAKH